MKRFVFGILILLLLPSLALAQTKAPATTQQKLTLEFVDGGTTLTVSTEKGALKFGTGIMEGDDIPVGSTIVTGADTSAELKMKPNGTIIKIAKSTTFTVKGLASTAKEPNVFALAAGKMRAVASKGANYQVTSQTAVCAVRGTDFSLDTGDGASKAVLMVAKGLVDFSKVDASGAELAKIPVAAGEAADALASAFSAFKFSPEQFDSQFGDVGFTKLKESDVPETAPEASADQTSAGDQAGNVAESAIMKWLRDNMGFEIGSVTMPDGKTYSKAILQPDIRFGKVKMGLYLPVVYSADLFDPNDWYHPAGNNEWSFGTEYFAKQDYMAGAQDLAIDLALKIKYLEIGTQMKDPFFIKIGNLEDLTLGHGLIMRNYANDTDFPSVRRIGFNMGIDGKSGGFEVLHNDLTKIATDNQIIGLRAFFKPVPVFALGVSAVVDTNPGSVEPSMDVGKMMMIGTGADIDIPFIVTDPLTIRGFADGAVTLPYVQEAFTYTNPDTHVSTPVPAGLKTNLVISNNDFRNWGAAGGLMGNILFIDFRLEYRYFTGNFRPSFFDSTYDRMRGQYAAQYAKYIAEPTSYSKTPNVMGVYGEGGFSLLKDRMSFKLAYMWPWSPDAGTGIQKQLIQSADEFHAKFTIKKGLIPIFDIAGSISYDKRGLARSIADKSFKLLDENTVFAGELDIPVPKTPQLDLAIIFKTVPVTKSDGTIEYSDAANGIPKLKPSVSIETRFHF